MKLIHSCSFAVMSVSWALLDESWTLFFCTRLSLSPYAQKFVQPTGSIFFLHLTMNWNESINLFISSWIDYFQNDCVSMWEQVGLHQVQTLQVLSEPFFLITAGISRSSAAGRELKIDGTTAARLWRSCVFLTCFWRERPPCKKKKMHKNWLCTTAMTESSQTVQLHWVQTDSLYISCLQIHG